MKNSIKLHRFSSDSSTNQLKQDSIHSVGGELKLFEDKIEKKTISLFNLIFLPFNFKWQIFLAITIMIKEVLVLYDSVFSKSVHKDLDVYKINNYYERAFLYFSEIMFWSDYILLLIHKNCKRHKDTKAYKEVNTSYLLLMLLTIANIIFVPENDDLEITLNNLTNDYFQYLELVVLLRLVRVGSFFFYLINSVYLNIYVCVLLFMSFIFISCTISACLFYMFIIDKKTVAGSVEDQIMYNVPMIKEDILSSWPMQNLGDVSLMSLYIVTNCFLMRGQATLQNYSFQLMLASVLYMCYSLIFTLIMISLYVVTLLELKLHSLILTFRMESLCSRLRLMNCDRIIVKRIESFYMNTKNKEGECVDLEMRQLLPSSLYRIYTFKTYGPALLHSHLFKKQDPAFLSAISLHMKTEFHFPGHILFSKGQVKDVFIYLERGIIQVMSCFDSSTPILSLFPGTCLGESTIVFQYASTSHIVCATHCQLAVLYKKNFDVLNFDFASHCRNLREEIIERNKKAQLNYKQRHPNDYFIASGHEELFNSLKKIKRFARVTDKSFKNRSVSYLSFEDLFFKTTKAHHEIEKYLNSDSNYLDMFVISESTERTRDDISFLTRDFPLILHPQSPFITLWNNIILVLVSFYVIYIPLYILVDHSDWNSDLLCCIIQTVFLIDLFAQTTFAIFTPEKDLISVKEIFFYRLTTTEFLADLIGSIPLNLIQVLLLKEHKMVYRFLQFNHLFRGWRIVQFFHDLFNKAPRHRIIFYTVFSMFTTALFLWYCSIVLFVMSCESRTKCNPNGMWQKINSADYTNRDTNKLGFDENISSLSLIISMFFILTRLTFGTSGDKYIPYTREEHIFVLTVNLISLFTLNFFIAFVTLLAYTMTQPIKELNEKMTVLVYLSNNYKLDSSLHKRILKRCNLLKQVENSGTHLKGESDFVDIGHALNADLKLNLWGDSIEKCFIFQNTDRKFARKIASKLNQIIVQPQEFVCFSGVFSPYMYIIHKGYCELIDTENGVVKSTKGPGYEFGGLEMLLDIPMLQSVRSMTYCEIIYLDKNDFYAILEDFPDYKDQIQATKDHCMPLVDLPIIEGRDTFKDEDEPKSKSFQYFGYNLVIGSKEERDFFNPIYKAGKGAVILSRVLMRATILPTGYFIWIMEIIRSVFAFASCIIFPAHQIMKITYGDYIDLVYAFLDVSAYIDIYFRFHVAFYNADGILVTHPLNTFINYAKTGLPLDLFACFPFEILLGAFVGEKYNVMLLYNRIFQVHRLFGLLEYINTSKIHIDLNTKAFKYFIIMIVFINAAASCWVTVLCIFSKDINIVRPSYSVFGVYCKGLEWKFTTLGYMVTPRRVYIKALFLVSTLLTHVNFIHFCENCDNSGWLTISSVYLGFVVAMYVFCKLSALSYLRNKNQHYKQEVNAALVFLSKSGVPKDLQNEFCRFFMTCWEHQRGENPEKLFRETLNDLLQGDIMFEIYGPCLKLNSVFTSCSNSFIRSIVFESKIQIFNKGAHILNEGFVHGDVYVLVDGIICLGTSNKRTCYLEKGALFGNLYDSEHSQQAVAVSAFTIVETLLIKSSNFHRILKSYPVEKTLFEAHRDKYSEVGMKFVPGKVAGTESMMDEVEVVELDSKTKYFLRDKRFDVLKLLMMGASTFLSLYSLAVFDVSPLMLCMFYFVDFIQIFLMFVCCHRPIKTSTGYYIRDSIVLRKHYIRQPINFGFDLLTVLPFETVGLIFPNNMYLFLVLRLNRSLNIIKFLKILNGFCSDVTRVQIKLQVTLLLLKLLIFLNMLSLIYTFNHITASGETFNTSSEKYLLYNAYRMMVIASFVKFPHSLDAAHKDYNEIIFLIRLIHICFNPILLAILAGNVVFYIHTYFYSVIKYVNLRRSILRGMQFHKTTKSITDTMKNYLRLLWDNHHGCQVPQLLLRSPVPLQQKLCWILYRHHFNEHLLFSGCNVLFLRQLIVHLKTQFLFPGNVAVESGIVDDTMYFVHKGEIDIYERDDIDSHSKWRFVSKMATGGCFGIEQGLGRGLAHSHRIVAHTCVTLLKLEFQSWSYLLYYYPVIRKKLIKYLANKGIS